MSSRAATRDNPLDFPIFSAPGNATAADFTLRVALPRHRFGLYNCLNNDAPVVNGETSWTLPIPGRRLIGQDGFIRCLAVNTHHPEPSGTRPALRTQAASVPS